MERLDSYDVRIIRYLDNKCLTINKISILTGFSWSTVKRKIEVLYIKGYVVKSKKQWELRR